MKVIWAAMLACCATGSWAGDLPSGQETTLIDSLLEEQSGTGETWLVLRYLAPRIARGAGDLTYEDVALDLDRLCETDGLEALRLTSADVAQIVIILMDREVPRGTPDPDAAMFISAYEPSENGCIWQ
ncbi:DUF6497 family protein [Actibacterium sp. 188UL27-1]|uniref:DUF6497 family protein n=1 Tax=Actibacterium sp. 188UL27-1 TaxID=2786961 RepID=UPI00195B6366|nr:DUF6497 family protein [Actibacterium sp. 188UL27-1]MBM7069567.1 hypothetical protein [Actibacterium sp. 188UL27-1]